MTLWREDAQVRRRWTRTAALAVGLLAGVAADRLVLHGVLTAALGGLEMTSDGKDAARLAMYPEPGLAGASGNRCTTLMLDRLTGSTVATACSDPAPLATPLRADEIES